jgi:radical SAM protein with 4Fe4S-binding SPASM domain
MDKILINKDGAKSVDDFLKIRDQKLPMENMIRKILKDKTPRYTEIEISFFELCALHCRFCWQDNYNPTGTNTIAEKAEIVVDYLKKQEAILQPNIQVHLLGGELFEDSNDYYAEYTAFINRIFEHCQLVLPDKELMFVFLTNMNFQKDETKAKLESFLNGLRAKGVKFILTTSWDPTGRPLKGDIETQFHKNITHFKDDLSEVTFVLTKPTIKKLLEDKNDYLSLLVEQGFNVDYDYYMPTTWADSLMPSDRDLLNAFRYLIYKFPGIRKLKSWLEPEEEACRITCASLNKITILPDGTITNCRHLNYDAKDFDTEIFNESNSDIIMKYITKKECLSCPFFKRCPLSCFVMADHKKFLGNTELDECFYKILFRETDDLRNK